MDAVAIDLTTLAADVRVSVGRLTRRLREQGSAGDFTHSQSAVLIRIERDGPASATDLAAAEGMRPQSMGTIVATLIGLDLLEGSADPADGRRTILSLTEKARHDFAVGRLAKEDWLYRTIGAQLTDDEQRTLAEATKLLARLAGAAA